MAYPSPPLTINGKSVWFDFSDGNEGRALTYAVPPDGPVATAQLKCAGADFFAVCLGLKGGVTVTGRTFVYHPPFRIPAAPFLLCTQIGETRGLKPRVAADGWVGYESVVFPAVFTTPTWSAVDSPTVSDASGMPNTTTRFRTSANIVAPPIGSYYYTAGTHSGKPVQDSSVGIVQGRVEVSMTRHGIPFPFLNDIMLNIGKVNEEIVTIGDFDFLEGTLLFAGCDNDYQPYPDGSPAWDYTFTFLGNEGTDWNEFVDPSGAYQLVNTKADGTGDPAFAYISFANLFGYSF